MTDSEIIKWLDSQLTAKSGYLLIRLDNGNIHIQTGLHTHIYPGELRGALETAARREHARRLPR